MPRLVSLTLLSLLAVPAGALLYFIVVVAGFEMLTYRDEEMIFFFAGLLTFGFVAAWWLLLWRSSVQWTSQRTSYTLTFTVVSILCGAIFGFMAGSLSGEASLGIFFAGCSSIVIWLGAMCFIWRDNDADRVGGTTSSELICPKCGYALVGLTTARCPECGEQYTLDQLFLLQQPDSRMAD